MTYRKKLIEVALPLEEINIQSAHEKSIRHGHPSTLHLWWARRPLAACRAVLFASLVDDPSEYLANEEAANAERQRLFKLIERLVNWNNITDEKLLTEARLEIARSVARNLGVDTPIGEAAVREFLATKAPPVLDPFAGGGSIPFEAQRLGLRAYASDLNPVAVLINKALIEIPPRFAGQTPAHPSGPADRPTGKKGSRKSKGLQMALPTNTQWKGAAGLAEDVRYYGQWMRGEAEKRIGHLYPKVKLPSEFGGGEAPVIAWLWARTVECPNPACRAQMPLVRSFWLSKNKSNRVWISPSVDQKKKLIRYQVVKNEKGAPPENTINRRGAKCIICESPVDFAYIRSQGKLGRINHEPMAIVAEGTTGRIYLPPDHKSFYSDSLTPSWTPNVEMPYNPFSVRPPLYGLNTFSELFAARQLVALDVFCDLITESRKVIEHDAIVAGMTNDGVRYDSGGSGAKAYSEAISVYLAFALDKLTDLCNSMCIWEPVAQCPRNLFGRQAMAMQWNFAEGNPLGDSSGSWSIIIGNLCRNLVDVLSTSDEQSLGYVSQADATALLDEAKVICTDPPYYNNVDYADLSDFFYVWLRHNLGGVFPKLFSTVLVPKAQELVATPYRFDNDKKRAEEFFEKGLSQAFEKFREIQSPEYPVTVFYAFKQVELDEDSEDVDSESDSFIASTGWETMLEGLLSSKFVISGTWPMRTEMTSALKAKFNSLASSIVLVCRPRPADAILATRREFIAALKRELPPAFRQLQLGSIAPVDLAQAAIGPGMAVFSRYSQVLEADGTPLRVRTALALINQALDEYLAEQEGEFDGDTRWALTWFEQHGHDEGLFGDAETLSKAKNTSIDGLVRAGVVEARAGKVRLLRRDELNADWSPATDTRQTVWEACQYLIRALDTGGESAAADLLRQLGSVGESAHDLTYRLYAICERKGWAQEALAYNMLAATWLRLVELVGQVRTEQAGLL